ncbi:MAG: PIN domain-containing protein [Treponema sp.]|nr:PIN domain-containing protein [Treponema sp.]
MKIYLLDTNIISEPTKVSPSEKVIRKLADNLDHSCISSITWAEVLSGVKTLAQGKRRNALFDYYVENVQKLYEIIPFDSSSANVYSDLYERLKSKGKPAQTFDLMIASIAIANNLILVTRNLSDFSDIAENSTLMLENWFEDK